MEYNKNDVLKLKILPCFEWIQSNVNKSFRLGRHVKQIFKSNIGIFKMNQIKIKTIKQKSG